MNLAAVASPIKQPAKKASLGRGGPKSAVAAPKQKTRGAAKVRTGTKCRPAGLDSQGGIAAPQDVRATPVKSALAATPRAPSVGELRDLHQILSTKQQGHVDDGLAISIRELAVPSRTRHLASEVRLLVARCLAEGFRVFAPEPPLQGQQLEETLALFVEQLGQLMHAGVEEESSERLVLLQRLVEVKAFVLLLECSEPGCLLVEMLQMCMKVMRAGDPHSAEGLMAQGLAAVLHAVEELPAEVMYCLLTSILQKSGEDAKKAWSFSCRVLAAVAQKSTAASVNEYLAFCLQPKERQVLVMEENRSRSAKKWLDVADAYEVTSEVFKIDPQLCSRVLPLIQADLTASSREQRQQATKAAGSMLAYNPASTGLFARGSGTYSQPLVTTHVILLERFLDRLGDAEDEVRLAALDGAEAILLTAATCLPSSGSAGTSPGRSGSAFDSAVLQVREAINARCLDPHEAIRMRVVRLAAKVAASEAGLKLLEPLLPTILRRVLDKRPKVREVSLEAAATLYGAHLLPRWIEGEFESEMARSLAWLPRLLCEAFSVFVSGKNGHTIQLEEHMEQHILGCGGKYDPAEKAASIAGVCACVASDARALRGFTLLLSRKRDANLALRRYLAVRQAQSAPVLEAAAPSSSSALVAVQNSEVRRSALAEGAGALQDLARLSPLLEERNARAEACVPLLRAFDAVRDKSLWETLRKLCNVHEVSADVSALSASLVEMDRLLRVHRLTEATPLLRRALMSTWLLPPQVKELLRFWRGEAQPAAQVAANSAMAILPQYFPDAFWPHVDLVVSHLEFCSPESAAVALKALAALGKHAAVAADGKARAASIADEGGHTMDASATSPKLILNHFLKALLRAIASASEHLKKNQQEEDIVPVVRLADRHDPAAAACRHAVRALGLLTSQEEEQGVQELLRHAEEMLQAPPSDELLASAMRLATACFEWQSEALRLQRSDLQWAAECHRRWMAVAEKVLAAGCCVQRASCFAALPLQAAAGIEPSLAMPCGTEELHGMEEHILQATLASLRGLRRATLPLTTQLLACTAQQVIAILHAGYVPAQIDLVVVALQKFQKPSAARMRVADHLRVCGTLPAVLAFSVTKRHCEAATRSLQNSLAKAAQRRVGGETLLDFIIACFVHFLAHLDCLGREAAAPVSPFTESTQVANVLAEALILCDEQAQSSSFTVTALRVTERVRYFRDRECPESDLIHKAAQCVRFAVEKRCPDMQRRAASVLHSSAASRGSMPAELFEIQQDSVRPQQVQAGPADQARCPAALEEGSAGVGHAVEQPALLGEPLPAPKASLGQAAGAKRAGLEDNELLPSASKVRKV